MDDRTLTWYGMLHLYAALAAAALATLRTSRPTSPKPRQPPGGLRAIRGCRSLTAILATLKPCRSEARTMRLPETDGSGGNRRRW